MRLKTPLACVCDQCGGPFLRYQRTANQQECDRCRERRRSKERYLESLEQKRADARARMKSPGALVSLEKRKLSGALAATKAKYKRSDKGRAAAARAKRSDRGLATRRAYDVHTHKRVGRAKVGWRDRDCIAVFYAAARIYREAGLDVEVDHVIPLHGEYVCGLHVENNLQFLPAIDNGRKNNSFEGGA